MGTPLVQVQLLGPVRAWHFGDAVAVRGVTGRSVLARLALDRGETVTIEALMNAVWGDHPPTKPAANLHTAVSRLRGGLGADVIETSAGGYAMSDGAVVDVAELQDALSGLDGADPAAAQRLEACIARFGGTPIEDVATTGVFEPYRVMLRELQLVAYDHRDASLIEAGQAESTIPELWRRASSAPLREQTHLLLADALSRVGRATEALRVLDGFRTSLAEQSGLSPSSELDALVQRVLQDDSPSIGSESARPTVGDGAEPGSGIHQAPAEPAVRPGNLPKPLSSFLGRADEIGQIAQFLMGARLVTLRGLGGIGKTSLALRVADDSATEFPDGMWFVDLAYVAPAAPMPERFLAALGLRSRPEVAPLDQLLTHLRPLRALLVVDNCEGHIDEISEVVGGIVRSAPDVHVLATSRSSLAVASGAVWQVGPLDVATAVELFAERARRVRHGFELSDANRPVVESICDKLDGIPLAIELAAARLTVLSVDQVLDHLDDRFELLRDHTSARHEYERTLKAALDWSYALLDEREQSLLRRLAVFPAEFTLEAAKDICVADASGVGLVNSMGLLVEASLVVFEANDADPRYRLLETIREYAAEMLSMSERGEVALRHVTYYVEVASRIAIQHETDHVGAMRAADRDLDNLRAAMACAFAEEDPERGLSVARNLRRYFSSRQLYREFLRWLQAGLERIDLASEEGLLVIASALVAAVNSEDFEVADRLAERVVNGIDLAGSPAVRAELLSSYAAYLIDIDPRAADELLAAATELDTTTAAVCVHNRQWMAWVTGDLPHADAMIADLDALPDGPLVRKRRLLVEIQAAACAGKWDEVIDSSLEHYGLDEETSSDLLLFRAEALSALGRIDEAIVTVDQLDEFERREGLVRTGSRIIRATIELRRGGTSSARSLLAESAASFGRESERVRRMSIASLAGVAAHRLDEDHTAALLFGYARTICEEFDINLRMSERSLVEDASRQCQATLSPDRFDELADRGSASNWADLVELLLPA